MEDGPRPVAPEEFNLLMHLVDRVFREGEDGAMRREYPHLFSPDNLDNLHVIKEDGKIVSHVGTTIRDAVILGCSIRVANVGAVSTDPDYRGRGYAGACFESACLSARNQGVDIMLVSGDRKLYRLAGCRPVGLDQEFTVTAEAATGMEFPAGPDQIKVERYKDEHLQAIKRLYENEPVRYLRPLEEWQRFIRDGRTTQHSSELWIIRRHGAITAYAAIFPPRGNGASALEEFAGDRGALLGALHELLRLKDLKTLDIHVQSHDVTLLSALGSRAAGSPPVSGTQLIINFPQFMEKLRPLMQERIGTTEARKLSFHEADGRLVFSYDDVPVVSTDRAGAVQLLFGTCEPPEWDWSTESGVDDRGRRALQATFPIPALVYGFSYV